uniref:M20/M25/M40 family metallo-hydrolase n=1 Tax=Janibacter limosus TaxID=53458 RepID=A0AC61U8P3_9MICO|nr:M20/M25/M40 family metallo-hydrolase [Janibacter limosus]
MDVVPPGDESRWAHPPLAAEVVDGAVWGRGTLDDKGQLVAVIAAVESLLADGQRPAREVWLSFGSDEEVMGSCAGSAVEILRSRGVAPWFVLDEGGAVASGAFPGVTRPLGVVGVSEKGVLSLRLTASGRGGHASRPAKGVPPPAWPPPSPGWSATPSRPTSPPRPWRCCDDSRPTCPHRSVRSPSERGASPPRWRA